MYVNCDVSKLVGKQFFKIVNKHFPENNTLHKIFNKNTLKISYSCMKNMSDIISSHNNIYVHYDMHQWFKKTSEHKNHILQKI